MEKENNSKEVFEERCSSCGKGLNHTEGRFRMQEWVFCMKCYYMKNHLDKADVQDEVKGQKDI